MRAWFHQMLLRCKSVGKRKQLDRDIDDELAFHLEKRAQDNRAAGMDATEARYAARRTLGSITRLKEISRELWTFASLQTFWQDLRYGARVLTKNPGFSFVAILTLTLGIGANTAMFSVVNGVLLNPLPFPEPERVVVLYENKVHFEHGAISYPNFLDWQNDNRSFAEMAAFRPTNFSMTGAGDPERVNAEMISAEFFPILGVQPLSGRMFTSDEDGLGAAPVALISEGFWRRKFGSAPDILSRAIILDGTSYAVIGIVPASFHLTMFNFFLSPDVYVPIGQWTFDLFRDRATVFGMDAIGRLKPGATLAQARADMEGVTRRLAEAYPKANEGIGASLVPLKKNMVGDLQPLLLLLLGAVGFVLLIACVNVASLLLARATGRAREFGIRSALGASRARLIRQLLTESILLAAAGGLLGVLLASVGVQAGVKLALRLHPLGVARAEEIGIDARVLAFTAVLALVAGILFGLAPAFKTRHRNLQETLKEGVRGTTAARSRAQRLFVVSELAMALILLVGAGLMIRSLVSLWNVNPGFNPNNVVTFYLSLAPSMDKAGPDKIRAAFRQVSDTISSVPGVESVALMEGSLPMQGDSEDPFWIEGKPKPVADNDKPWALWYEVDPNYLKAMGIPLRRGRFFTDTDNSRAPRVAVIDETFAATYFPNEDPIGKRIVDDYVGPTEVVGIVGHVKHWGLDDKVALHAQMYFPFAQIRDKAMPNLARSVAVVVRARGGSAGDVMSSIRAAVTQMDRQQVIFAVYTMDETISASLADRRFLMILLMVFAALALLLASVGIYGVLSYLVGQRIPEIGIRLALGAQRDDVLRLILGEGMRMAFLGVAIGLAGALVLSRLLANLLFGISAADPVTFAGVVILLTTIAIAACYIPARRAMRVDPIVALRYE
jgi:predicted permease